MRSAAENAGPVSAARILNVNDQVAARYVVSRMLARAGFEVVEAGTGETALAQARDGVDAVVLDVNLPDMDGYEITRRLKGDPSTSSIPILLTSAAIAGASQRIEGLESGAEAYLAQPFETAELAATLRALLRVRAAEREAREALRAREDFLSVASHELRTPLTSLSLQAQSLERLWRQGRAHTLSPEAVLHKLEVIARQSRQLGELLDDLLDVSRIRAGRLELRPEPLDLAQVARETVDRHASLIARTGAQIELAAPCPVLGRWDRLRMEQVVANLVSNACKYGRGRPVRVSIADELRQAAIVVADEGIGIAPEDRQRIFERFERAAVDPNRPGMGLGLWIVRQIVTACGGTIDVESEVGRGSTFTVRLPREP